MQSREPLPEPGSTPAVDRPADAPAPPTSPPPATVPHSHAWLWATAVALLAGLLSWLAQEQIYGHFKPEFDLPANFARMNPYEKTDVKADLTRKATPAAEQKNSAAAYGLLGAALAGALGLVGGFVRRSPGAALLAALFGVVAGGAAGGGMSFVMTRYFYQHLEPETGMTLALWTHGGIWVPIGAAAGLAFGIGLGGLRSVALALIGGLGGGLVGTMLFEVANAILFPLVRVLEPVPAGKWSRLLVYLCVALFVALGSAISVRKRTKPAAPSAELA